MASSWTESVSVLAGPALAALLLDLSGPGAVFGAMAFALACSGLLVTGVEGPVPTSSRPRGAAGRAGRGAGHRPRRVRALARERLPRLSVGLLTAQFLLVGALDVLLVVLAFEVLDIGSAGSACSTAPSGPGPSPARP